MLVNARSNCLVEVAVVVVDVVAEVLVGGVVDSIMRPFGNSVCDGIVFELFPDSINSPRHISVKAKPKATTIVHIFQLFLKNRFKRWRSVNDGTSAGSSVSHCLLIIVAARLSF